MRKASNLNLRNHLALGISRSFNAVQTAVSTVGGLRGNRHFILQMIQLKGGPEALYFASEELRRDPEIALKAIQQDRSAIRFLSETLKKDRAFMLSIISFYADAIHSANEDLRRDPAFVLDAIQRNSAVFVLIPGEERNDSAFVLNAIQRNSEVFWLLPDQCSIILPFC